MPLTIVTMSAWRELEERLKSWQPKSRLGKAVREALRYLPPDLAKEMLEHITGSLVVEATLSGIVWRRCTWCGGQTGPSHLGTRDDPCHPWAYTPCTCPEPVRLSHMEELGVLSTRVVTNSGVNYIVDAFQNLVEPEAMRYHGIGTGTAAEAVGDTALAAELTTQYSPDNTRATGTLGEGATANVFRTQGTNTVDEPVTITEHGIFTQAAVPGGTLLDRSVFAGIALASGDSLQTTYDLTFNAGG